MRQYTVVLTPYAEQGGYTVTAPALPGCITEGGSVEEALAMARDAIDLYIESLVAHDASVPADVAEQPRIERVQIGS
jgi:antitoxin HicB